MTLDELRSRAAELFPLAVAFAVEHPGETNPALRELKADCWIHYQALGFSCMADCFDEVAPRLINELSLAGWSSKELTVEPWTVRVRCRPFHISSWAAHLEIHHKGPLPGVTETGYRSMFVPMQTFAEVTPEDYLRSLLAPLPKSQQMELL